MKRLARPSLECLQELESIKNQNRIDSLQKPIKDFLIDGTKHAYDLKAYHKILADSERYSRTDPNNELWLAQLQDKTTRHQQCLNAIDALVIHTVHAIDQHSRSEAISIIGTLVQGGYFDAPLPPKNNQPSSSSNATAISSSSTSETTLTTSIATIQKTLDNERKERDDSIQSLRQQFEEYRDFNNNRFTESQQNLNKYKQSLDAQLKDLADLHRKEINSLKAGYQLAQMKHSLEPKHSPVPAIQAHNNNNPTDQDRIQPIMHLQEQQQALTKQLNNHQNNLNKHSLADLIEDTRTRLDQLTQLTTTALDQIQPEIKRITNSIQLQVIKSTKTVISDGHQDISSLIRDMFTKLQEQVDQLGPMIEQSSSQILRLDSDQKTFQTDINQNFELKLKEIYDQIQTLESKSLKREDLDNNFKQIDALKNQICDIETKALGWKDDLSKSIDEFKVMMGNISPQFDEIKRSFQSFVCRLEGIEKSMTDLENDQRYSTPAPEPIYSNHLRHQSSQTPPSPATSRRMSQPVPADLTRTSPSTGYHQYNRNSETVQQPFKLINNHHDYTTTSTSSQNIPIAARFTSAPSLNTTGPPSSSSSSNTLFTNNNNHHPPKKRKQSREPSLALSTNRNMNHNNSNNNNPNQQQSSVAARGVGMNGEGANQNHANVYNYHPTNSSQEFRENSYDPHQFYQQNRFADQMIPAVKNNANATFPPPQSTLPLAKRLKADLNPQRYPNHPVENDHYNKYNPHYPGHHQIHNPKKFHQQSTKRH